MLLRSKKRIKELEREIEVLYEQNVKLTFALAKCEQWKRDRAWRI